MRCLKAGSSVWWEHGGWGGERRGHRDKNKRLGQFPAQVNYVQIGPTAPSHTPNPRTRDVGEKAQGQSRRETTGPAHSACHWSPDSPGTAQVPMGPDTGRKAGLEGPSPHGVPRLRRALRIVPGADERLTLS